MRANSRVCIISSLWSLQTVGVHKIHYTCECYIQVHMLFQTYFFPTCSIFSFLPFSNFFHKGVLENLLVFQQDPVEKPGN